MRGKDTGQAVSTSRVGTRLASRRSLAVAGAAADSAGNGPTARRVASTSSGIRLRPRTSISTAAPAARTGLFAQTQHVASSSQSSMTTRSGALHTTSRARRVLVQPKDRTAALPSSGSVSTASGGSTTSVKTASSTTRARRLSRVKASQVTGMGIVRAGPAVEGHRTPGETASSQGGSHALALDTGSTSDPFSTAFVRPPLPSASETLDGAAGQGARLFKPLPSTAAAILSPVREANAGASYDRNSTTASSLLRNARIVPHSPTKSPSRIFQIFDDGAASRDTDDKRPRGASLPYRDLHATALPLGTHAPATSSRKRSADTLHSDEPVGGSSNPATPSKRAPKRLHIGTPTGSTETKTGEAPVGPDAVVGVPAAATSGAAGGAAVATPRAASPTLSRPSPRSAPMQRTVGRVYGLPDLTAMPVSTSPRLFVPRAQLDQQSRDGSAAVLSSPGLPRSNPTLSPPEQPDEHAPAPSPALLPSLSVAPSIPSPSTLAPVTSNLILPTLSLFDPDRIVSDRTPAAGDGDMTMSDAGDVSTSSTTSSSTATSSRADETARRLANLQSMLSQLYVPKPNTAAGAALATSGARRVSVGAKTSRARNSIGSSASMPPPPVASHTARRASMVKAKSSAAAVSGSAGAPNLHRGPQMQSGSAAASARRKSLAGPLPLGGASAKSSNESSTTSTKLSTLAPGTTPFRTSSASNQIPTQRAARGKTCLQGVVAFVDVRTADGDDSGMIFVDMLKDLGARVTSRPSSLTTHIVFKSGKPTTLDFYRQASLARRPHLVGIAWVVRCSELHLRVEESLFRIEEAGSPSAAPGGGKENIDSVTATAQAALGLSGKPTKAGGGQSAAVKRRKSMEPRALAALNNARANLSLSSSNDSAMKATIAASIERARRKSLQYAPRVGSPLAKRVFVMPDPVTEE
ncbi:hypothetical protein JCM3774_005864 [Rhodotorula dairenensis]